MRREALDVIDDRGYMQVFVRFVMVLWWVNAW